MLQNPHVLLTFDKVHNPLRLPRETTSERPKVVRTPGVLYILTSKCASRHNIVHFLDISTSKSGPSMVCFAHFDLDTCTFSTAQLLKVLRSCGALYILTSKCASRHNGVQFFIWSAGSAPAAFRSHKSLEKHTVSRPSYLFAYLHLLSSDSFSSLICSLLLFSSLCLCPALLFICPYCRKFDF